MSIADFIIIAAVLITACFCVQSIVKTGGSPECAACASAPSCTAHTTENGACPVAKSMVNDAEEALAHNQ